MWSFLSTARTKCPSRCLTFTARPAPTVNTTPSCTDLIQLGQTTQAIYFAKLTNEGEQSELALTGDEIKARFSLVNQAWNN